MVVISSYNHDDDVDNDAGFFTRGFSLSCVCVLLSYDGFYCCKVPFACAVFGIFYTPEFREITMAVFICLSIYRFIDGYSLKVSFDIFYLFCLSLS